jgi:putative addiction module killer protein
VLPSNVIEILYHLSEAGRSPFEEWFSSLDSAARAKVAVAIARLEQGNISNAKSVGDGVLEYRINFGSGYRVYFGRHGAKLVILLLGGTKKRQAQNIAAAARLWANFKQRTRLSR